MPCRHRVGPEETGRPGYRPADLLKLYIYGYLNRIRSSRRLDPTAHPMRGDAGHLLLS
jgi:transposase